MADVPEIFNLDREFAIINVLGVPMKSIVGFSIGGQASAGASTFYAAMREFLFLSRLPPPVLRELQTRTLCVRWLDDVLHAYPTDLSPGALRAMRQLQHRRFYGGTLELLYDKDVRAAFGFWVQARRGVLLIRERLTFTHTKSALLGNTGDVWPLLPPEWQFGSRKTSYNIALGRLTRHLDTTNADQSDVLSGLKRILSELRSVGYSSGMLNRAVKQLTRTATVDLDPLKKFNEGDSNLVKQWSSTYDLFLTRLWDLKSNILRLTHSIEELA